MKGDDVEFQPRSSFVALAVPPGANAELFLPGGQKRPFIYSLSTRSTVPYVQYVGGGDSQKVFGWNEIIEVPPGQMVRVRNASHHQGDIVINSGADFSTVPPRITVPVSVSDTGAFFRGDFPVDTRRARRAFLTGIRNPPATEFIVRFFHFGTGSYSRNVALAVSPSEGAQIVSAITFAPSTQPSLVPAGIEAAIGDPVHALLDYVEFEVTNTVDIATNGSLIMVLEYA